MALLFVPSVHLRTSRTSNGIRQSRYAGVRLPRRTFRPARMNMDNETTASAADTSTAPTTENAAPSVVDEEVLLEEPPVPSVPNNPEAAESTGIVMGDDTIEEEAIDSQNGAVLTKSEIAHNEWLDSLLSTADSLPMNHPFTKSGIEADVRQKPPTRRIEDWRFTDLRSIYGARYDQSGARSQIDANIDIERHLDDGAAAVLVFLDGVYSEERSLFDEASVRELVDAGGRVGSLNEAKDMAEMFEVEQLNGCLERKGYSGLFPALNSKLARDAAVIDVPKNLEMKKHIVVLCVATAGGSAEKTRVSAPRLTIRAGTNSRVHVLEAHLTSSASDESHSLILACTSVKAESDSKIKHCFANTIDREAQLLAHVYAKVESGAEYVCTNVLVGGRVSRMEATIELTGNGSRGEMLGAAVTDQRRVADVHSRIIHGAKHTSCNQLQKNIAADRGRTVFSGKIIVPKGSDFTEADQLCRSLLLSERAQVDAMPVLEIATDEVKATHGATVSDLQPDEVFYCQSRGISADSARALLISGFVMEILGDCPLSYMKDVVEPVVDEVAEAYVASKRRQLEMSSI